MFVILKGSEILSGPAEGGGDFFVFCFFVFFTTISLQHNLDNSNTKASCYRKSSLYDVWFVYLLFYVV
jgi:hypothetical protein